MWKQTHTYTERVTAQKPRQNLEFELGLMQVAIVRMKCTCLYTRILLVPTVVLLRHVLTLLPFKAKLIFANQPITKTVPDCASVVCVLFSSKQSNLKKNGLQNVKCIINRGYPHLSELKAPIFPNIWRLLAFRIQFPRTPICPNFSKLNNFDLFFYIFSL